MLKSLVGKGLGCVDIIFFTALYFIGGEGHIIHSNFCMCVCFFFYIFSKTSITAVTPSPI